jgi:hypothetical protein
MLHSQASAATATALLHSADAANTAGATSGNGLWLDVRPYDGEILVCLNVGVVTAGTITGKLQSATDANGAGADDISGYTFTAAGTSTDLITHTCVVDPKKVVGGFLGFVGTIATGPAQCSVVAIGKKKVV